MPRRKRKSLDIVPGQLPLPFETAGDNKNILTSQNDDEPQSLEDCLTWIKPLNERGRTNGISIKYMESLSKYNTMLFPDRQQTPVSNLQSDDLKLEEIFNLEDAGIRTFPSFFANKSLYGKKRQQRLNEYMNKWHERDNLLARSAFRGIRELNDSFPSQIYDGLNAMELILILSAVQERKDVYLRVLPDSENRVSKYVGKVIRARGVCQEKGFSRMALSGFTSNETSLYKIAQHLLDAPAIKKVKESYESEWKTLNESEVKGNEDKQFLALNPYAPSTLKERCDEIEKSHPEAVNLLKRKLANPIEYEAIYLPDQNGNARKKLKRGGFIGPGTQYLVTPKLDERGQVIRSPTTGRPAMEGVKGQLGFRVRSYIKETLNYLSR